MTQILKRTQNRDVREQTILTAQNFVELGA